jgi:hypothetical protein
VTDLSWLSAVAPYAVWANAESTFDRVGDGQATTSWTITGTRNKGKKFSLTRSNRWAVRNDDVSFDPALDFASSVDSIVENQFEAVKVSKVSFTSSMSSRFAQARITGMKVSVNGGTFKRPARLKVKAGDALRVRVSTRDFRGTTTHTTTVALKVPKKGADTEGTLSVLGGLDAAQAGDDGGDSSCLLEGTCESAPATSLTGLAKAITSAPRNDDVVVSLALTSEDDTTTQASAATRLSSVVTGEQNLAVSVRK